MVEAFKIIGGKKIAGELKVDGSKNSTLPIMIAKRNLCFKKCS